MNNDMIRRERVLWENYNGILIQFIRYSYDDYLIYYLNIVFFRVKGGVDNKYIGIVRIV